LELVDTELVLFLDDDAELIDGALEHMLADLDAHPDAAGITSLVVDPRGNVQHYGGWIAVSDEAAHFTLGGSGLPFDHPALPATGPSGWAPGTASLIRTQILEQIPIDDGLAAYYEDNDWCFRVEQRRPGSFRRCREALVLHHHDFTAGPEPSSGLVKRYETVERLAAQAHFLRASGLLLDVDLRLIAPELQRPDGSLDIAAARLLLELIAAKGVDWIVMQWMNGGLEPLLDGAHEESAQRGAEIVRLRAEAGAREAQIAQLAAHIDQLQAHFSELESHATALESERSAVREHVTWLEARHLTLSRVEAGGWWRLRARLLPLLRVAAAIKRSFGERT
jgi:hypothetical protein